MAKELNLPDPDMTDVEVATMLAEAVRLVRAVPESKLTRLVATLCRLVVAQRLQLIKLTAKTPAVADRLADAFLEGYEEARGE